MRRVLVGAVGIAAALLLVACSAQSMSDARMIDNFHAHKAAYARLASMFQADAKLESVGMYSEDWFPEPSKAGIDASRRSEYLSLMTQLGVQAVERAGDGILFTVAADGLAGSGTLQGYLFASQPPSPLVDDTNRAHDATDAPEGEVYRRIEDRWYLEYDWES